MASNLPYGARMAPDAGTPTPPERSFLIDDAARLLGVSRRTVYYRIREGRLLTVRARCGSQRVLLSSIEALLRESRAAGASGGPRMADDLRTPEQAPDARQDSPGQA